MTDGSGLNFVYYGYFDYEGLSVSEENIKKISKNSSAKITPGDPVEKCDWTRFAAVARLKSER